MTQGNAFAHQMISITCKYACDLEETITFVLYKLQLVTRDAVYLVCTLTLKDKQQNHYLLTAETVQNLSTIHINTFPIPHACKSVTVKTAIIQSVLYGLTTYY